MRQKLTITEVLEPRTIGDKNIPLQEFNANGKKYSVFSKALFPYIKLNTEIDAEIEVKSAPSGEWTNYKIIDIFVNGQSVKSQGQGGGYRGKSPEELELSRRSFSLAYAKDLAVAGIIAVKDIPGQATEFYDWMGVKTTATAVKKTAEQTRKEAGVTRAMDTSPEEASSLTIEPITTEQKERLKELQEKLPGRMKELCEEWGWNIQAISKLTKDQATHLVEKMEKELKEVNDG